MAIGAYSIVLDVGANRRATAAPAPAARMIPSATTADRFTIGEAGIDYAIADLAGQLGMGYGRHDSELEGRPTAYV